jgi:hypothetical protein
MQKRSLVKISTVYEYASSRRLFRSLSGLAENTADGALGNVGKDHHLQHRASMPAVVPAPSSDLPDYAKSPGFSTTISSLRHKNPAKSRAPKTRFHEAFHRDLGCPVPQRKNISLSVFPKSVIPYPVSRSQEGRTRRHERGARDAVDVSGVAGRGMPQADGEVVWS